MVPIVQLVRASDCGSECRGFESHWAPKTVDRQIGLFLCPVGFGPRVRNRRSRLSDSERIPLGTLKETDSSVSFFLCPVWFGSRGPSAVLQGKCARSLQKRGYRERFCQKTARGTFMMNPLWVVISLYHRQGLRHLQGQELYMSDW